MISGHTVARNRANDPLRRGVVVRVRIGQVSSIMGASDDYILDVAMGINGCGRKDDEYRSGNEREHLSENVLGCTLHTAILATPFIPDEANGYYVAQPFI